MAVIAARERNAILQSLAAGVVPAIGLHHIQVGRREEVAALVKDLTLVEQGSSTIRFIIGRFGSGKTFFLNLIRNVAMQRKFVVVQADITTERRLHGTGGHARSLYSELMRNLATRSRPEGGAMQNFVERWVGDIDYAIRNQGGTEEDVKRHLAQTLRPLQDLVSGFDFAMVVTRYYEGYQSHNELLQDNALRWLRAEYTTKTEAREALGVRTIIDDASLYDYLKLMGDSCGSPGTLGFWYVSMNSSSCLTASITRKPATITTRRSSESLMTVCKVPLKGWPSCWPARMTAWRIGGGGYIATRPWPLAWRRVGLPRTAVVTTPHRSSVSRILAQRTVTSCYATFVMCTQMAIPPST